jgi:catechol 2,3-dioxygenase-like lactoylglutathione lyase family enzyme
VIGGSPLTAFLATTDATRSKMFYQDVLGLRLLADDPFALAFDCSAATV